MAVLAKLVESDVEDDWTYKFDLSDFGMLRGGDTLASATVTCADSGISIGTVTVDATNNYVVVRIHGGTAGTVYHVSILATTTAGAILPARVNFSKQTPAGF